MVRVEVLGPVRLVADGEPVVLSPQLARLVGVLAVADGGVVSAGRIAEYVAAAHGEPGGGSSVRMAVSRLRKVIGGAVVSADGGYRLDVDSVEVDARRLSALRAGARTGDAALRVEVLREALALFRGDPFGELAGEEWAVAEAARLTAERAAVAEDLAEALLAAGRGVEAAELLESHLVEHPFRERPVGLLMRALHSDGRTVEGLRVLQRFRMVLRDEVGLDPSSELRAIETELLAATGDVRDVPSTGSVRLLPDGTVTFLFSDIEASTERWQDDEVQMAADLDAHDRVFDEVVSGHGGVVFKHTGDGVCAVFSSAPAAVDAAVASQRRLGLPVRIGVHTGEAQRRRDDYFGPTLNRVARVMDAGHGGQILLTEATAALVREHDVVDLGEHQVKGLAKPERIFQVGSAVHPELRVHRQSVGNLPTEASSFVGRRDDLHRLVDLLADHHVVTLLGVGGTGKTRLAIEAGHTLAPTFPDGCWIVELASVNVADAVPLLFATSLGIPAPATGDVVDHVIRRIRHQRMLLIVDNCEHVLATAADAIERIASACPTITIVATSREPLVVDGERLAPVPSLTADDAFELFAQRAAAEAPDLDLAGFDEPIRELCERLDRLPLAIELAASRLRAMTPTELLDAIEERFRLLVGGRRSRMERHQTMRGALDWSYDLCAPVEQAVFDRLSVFPTSFDLASARAVATDHTIDELDVIDAVPRLVDRSLIQRVVTSDGASRFRMLETMRHYGRGHLQHAHQADDVRRRHAEHTAAALGRLGLDQFGPDERHVLAEMAALLPDAAVAVEWALEHRDWATGMQAALAGFAAGHRPFREFYRPLLEPFRGRPQDLPPELQIVLFSVPDVDAESLERAEQVVLSSVLDGGLSIPADRFQLTAPYWNNWNRLSADDAARLVDSLRSANAHAAPVNRVYTTFAAALSLAADHPEHVARLVASIEHEAEQLDSDRARMLANYVRALLAEQTGDWQTAAALLEQVSLKRGPDDREAVSAAFRLLRATAAADLPITSRVLRAPWELLVDTALYGLQWNGAHATAAALARLGHDTLATDFARYLQCFPIDWRMIGPQAERLLLDLGIDQSALQPDPTVSTVQPTEPTDTLDDLIARLMRVADQLDTTPRAAHL